MSCDFLVAECLFLGLICCYKPILIIDMLYNRHWLLAIIVELTSFVIFDTLTGVDPTKQ